MGLNRPAYALIGTYEGLEGLDDVACLGLGSGGALAGERIAFNSPRLVGNFFATFFSTGGGACCFFGVAFVCRGTSLELLPPFLAGLLFRRFEPERPVVVVGRDVAWRFCSIESLLRGDFRVEGDGDRPVELFLGLVLIETLAPPRLARLLGTRDMTRERGSMGWADEVLDLAALLALSPLVALFLVEAPLTVVSSPFRGGCCGDSSS